MKSAKNSIAYAVRSLAICSTLFGALVAQAADRCALSFEQGALKPAEIQTLQIKGYDLRPKPYLSSYMMSLRLATDTNLWALVKTKTGFDLYFEVPSGHGDVPLMRFAVKSVEDMRECQAARKSVKFTQDMRKNMRETFPALRGEGKLLDALLRLEENDAAVRGVEYPAQNIRKRIEQVKLMSKGAWDSTAGQPMTRRLHAVRKVLLSEGLKSYCRDYPRFRDFVSRGCTNCVGQSLLWLGILDDLKAADDKNHFKFGMYEDHVQPVWINEKGEPTDLMNNRAVDPGIPLYDPYLLVTAGMKRWRNLIFAEDKIDPAIFNQVGEPGPPPTGALASSDEGTVHDWNFARGPKFSEDPTPESADLSELENLDPDVRGSVPPKRSGPRMQTASGSRTCFIGTAEALRLARETMDPKDVATADLVIGGRDVVPCDEAEQFVRPNQNYSPHRTDEPYEILQPIMRLEYSNQAAIVDGLPFHPVYENGYSKLVFDNAQIMASYRQMRYWDRMQRVRLEVKRHLNETIAPKLEQIGEILNSERPFWAVLRNQKFWKETSRNLEETLQLMDTLQMYNEELRKPLRDFQRKLYLFSDRMDLGAKRFGSQLNSMKDEEIEKVLFSFYILPTKLLNKKSMSVVLEKVNHELESRARFPLQKLFTGIIRDPENWEISAEIVSLKLPEGPKQGYLESLTGIDLPKVNLPCGQHGSFVVACPESNPKSDAKNKVSPVLLAGLGAIHPHVFYNPGDLLMLSQLWKSDVADQFDRLVTTWPFDASDEYIPQPMIYRALQNRGKIILGDTKDEALAGLKSCGQDSFMVIWCRANVTNQARAGYSFPVQPAWIHENPLYSSLLSRLEIEKQNKCPNFEHQGHVQSRVPWSEGDVQYSHIFDGGMYNGPMVNTKVGKVDVRYALISADNACFEKFLMTEGTPLTNTFISVRPAKEKTYYQMVPVHSPNKKSSGAKKK